MSTSAQADIVELRGTVEQVFHSSPNFSAGRFRTSDGNDIQFAGNLNAEAHAPLVLTGTWFVHPKYGRQFKVAAMCYDRDLDAAGLARYLAGSPVLKGIGDVKARLIAAKFAQNFRYHLEHDIDEVARVAKVPTALIEKLRDHWIENEDLNNLKAELASYELTNHQIEKIVERYGINALGILRNDPYVLINDVDGLGFARVDKIARKMGVMKDDGRRVDAAIIHCVDQSLDNGNCWIEYEELINEANKVLVMDSLDSKEIIEHALDDLLEGERLVYMSTDSSRILVAKPEIRRMEEDISKALKCAFNGNPHFEDIDEDDILAEAIELTPDLNAEQAQAVVNACCYSISLMTGGAGVGKTYTVSAMARVFARHGLSVRLAAPTGKAAKRMQEACGRDACTIHRMLGYNGNRFKMGPSEPLEDSVLIIDESSMIDTTLAWHLLRAVNPNTTSIVLVGDHNQLPPVGPGNPLRDLINTRIVPATVLGSVQRHAGHLKDNSCAILRGEVRGSSPENDEGRRAWYLVDHLSEPLKVQLFLKKLYSDLLRDKLGFHLVNDVQLLTPTHKGPLGTRDLNILLQSVIQKKLWDLDVMPVEAGRKPRFYVNDKVIQTKNDYDLGVMNGTLGIIREVRKDGTLVVDFGEQWVTTHSSKNIELAYVLTIHKAQGSEFPCSIVVAHKSHSFMHHRNLLYTGVTRATTTAIILGDRWGIANCVKRVQVDERKTFLPFLVADISAYDRTHMCAELGVG